MMLLMLRQYILSGMLQAIRGYVLGHSRTDRRACLLIISHRGVTMSKERPIGSCP